MPGRTTKSLQNMWTKIQKEAAALDDGAAATPKKATRKISPNLKYFSCFMLMMNAARKARGKKAADDEDDSDGVASKKATPKKRGGGGKSIAWYPDIG